MKNAIFVTNLTHHIDKVYDTDARTKIGEYYTLAKTIITKQNIEEHIAETNGAEAIFSTWGMPHFTSEEIDKYFPNVKYVFYGAGSVQDFAKEFLEKGVRVFSAASANSIPVKEYTISMIMLANKLGPHALKRTNSWYYKAQAPCMSCPGNYKTKIGIVGAGKIGSSVITALQSIGLSAEYYAYDPFLSEERAAALNVKVVSLEELFSTCDIISNHLANKDELTGVLNYALFSKMKDKATFINSGRGRQVVEKDLVKALKEKKGRSAILDVTFPEPPSVFSPLRRMKNIYLTPHIAGSLGGEVARMGDYMVDDAISLEKGDVPANEVTLEMLKTLA